MCVEQSQTLLKPSFAELELGTRWRLDVTLSITRHEFSIRTSNPGPIQRVKEAHKFSINLSFDNRSVPLCPIGGGMEPVRMWVTSQCQEQKTVEFEGNALRNANTGEMQIQSKLMRHANERPRIVGIGTKWNLLIFHWQNEWFQKDGGRWTEWWRACLIVDCQPAPRDCVENLWQKSESTYSPFIGRGKKGGHLKL